MCVCVYMCVYVSSSRQWHKIQRDRKSIWKKLSRLSVYSSTVSYLYSLATLSLSLSLFLLFLFFIAGVWTPVARNTSRFWRFALCDQFQFQLLKVFKVTSPAMDSPLCVVFLLFFFIVFFPLPRVTRGETFSHPVSNDEAVLQFLLYLFLPVSSPIHENRIRYYISYWVSCASYKRINFMHRTFIFDDYSLQRGN